MKQILLTFCLVLLTANFSLASVAEVFGKNYYDSYREGKCGLNVLNFFETLESKEEDVSGLSLVYLENKGLSVFGMVNAEKARTQSNGQITTQEMNWYQHQFAIDKNGIVYDFDYMNSPRPVPFKDYIEDMFLNEDECNNHKPGEFCAGRDNKLNDYHIKLYEAKDILNEEMKAYWSGSLSQALEKFKD